MRIEEGLSTVLTICIAWLLLYILADALGLEFWIEWRCRWCNQYDSGGILKFLFGHFAHICKKK